MKAIVLPKRSSAEALRENMIAVGQNTRQILKTLTLAQINIEVPEGVGYAYS